MFIAIRKPKWDRAGAYLAVGMGISLLGALSNDTKEFLSMMSHAWLIGKFVIFFPIISLIALSLVKKKWVHIFLIISNVAVCYFLYVLLTAPLNQGL
jgi:hypothetical protein